MTVLLSFSWSEYWPFILLGVIAIFFLATRPLVQQRNRRLRQFAETHGFMPVRKPQRDMKALKLLAQGHSRSFELAYERADASGFTVRFFEYSYFLHVPPATVGYMQTVIAFRVPGQELFAFQLTPAIALGKLGVKLGLENIVPYDSTTFADRYRLRGEVPNAVQLLFRPELVRLLEAIPIGREWTIESAGDWMIFYQTGTILEPESLGEAIANAGAWLNLFYGREYFRVPAAMTPLPCDAGHMLL